MNSKSKLDVILTIEEAEALALCDPDTVTKLETFLAHHGFNVNDKEEEKGSEKEASVVKD